MFTENLKQHRVSRGLSQGKLAEIADVSLRTIQRLESGESEPRGDTVIRIANGFRYSTWRFTAIQESGRQELSKSFTHLCF